MSILWCIAIAPSLNELVHHKERCKDEISLLKLSSCFNFLLTEMHSSKQCAGAIFDLDQKFQSQNCLFLVLWCKSSLNWAKNPSVNRVPSKVDFFTIKFTACFPSIYSKKVHFGGNPVNRWIFYLIQTCFKSK